MNGPFKRLNFFKGFATTAEDWQAASRYHSEKMRMHNKYFHSPGVIDGLTVTATRDGTGIRVEPGMALDSEGQELYLPQAHELAPDLQTFRSKTIYLTIEHHEKPIDFRDNSLNTDYAGHAFIEELPSIAITTEPPNNKTKLELARVEISSDVKSIRNPKNLSSPTKDEINSLSVVRPHSAGICVEDLATYVNRGDDDTVNGRAAGEGPRITTIPLEFGPSSERRFYVASVRVKSVDPITLRGKESEGLTWQIMAHLNDQTISYNLLLFNDTTSDMTVAWEAYRFNLIRQ